VRVHGKNPQYVYYAFQVGIYHAYALGYITSKPLLLPSQRGITILEHSNNVKVIWQDEKEIID